MIYRIAKVEQEITVFFNTLTLMKPLKERVQKRLVILVTLFGYNQQAILAPKGILHIIPVKIDDSLDTKVPLNYFITLGHPNLLIFNYFHSDLY